MPGPGRGLAISNPLDSAEWDQNASHFSEASFFHSSAWARVLIETYGFTPLYLTAQEPGFSPSMLPMMESRSWLKGTRGIALPFTDECAWLRPEAAPLAPLIEHLQQLARNRNWRSWEIRGGPAPSPSAFCSLQFWRHTLKLDRDPMANFARVESSVRRAIRKADQSSLSVEISSSPESARAFYDLLRLTRRRHGLPPQPISFFQNIQRHVLSLGLGSIVLAKLNHQAVAGALFVRSGKKAIFKFGASDERHQQHRPNNLVMWRAIEWLANSGCTSLDFGRTSLANTGLRQYKLGWGTAEAELQYYRFDMRNSAFVTDKDDSIGWHNRVFRLLPLPVSRLAGEFAYRHLA